MKLRTKPSMLGLGYAVLKANDVIPKFLDFFISHLGTEATPGESDCGGKPNSRSVCDEPLVKEVFRALQAGHRSRFFL